MRGLVEVSNITFLEILNTKVKILHITFYVKKEAVFEVEGFSRATDSVRHSKENAVQKESLQCQVSKTLASTKNEDCWELKLTKFTNRNQDPRTGNTSTCEDGWLRSHPCPGQVSALLCLHVQLSINY